MVARLPNFVKRRFKRVEITGVRRKCTCGHFGHERGLGVKTRYATMNISEQACVLHHDNKEKINLKTKRAKNRNFKTSAFQNTQELLRNLNSREERVVWSLEIFMENQQIWLGFPTRSRICPRSKEIRKKSKNFKISEFSLNSNLPFSTTIWWILECPKDS